MHATSAHAPSAHDTAVLSFGPRHRSAAALISAVLFSIPPAFAQHAAPAAPVRVPDAAVRVVERASLEPATALPEAPGVSSSSTEAVSRDAFGQIANQKEGSQPSLNPLQRLANPRVPTATDVTIAPGQVAPHQTAKDKLLGSIRDSISPFSLAGELISAGYSQGIDSSPNYGQDISAFGQRVGASVARGTSQNIFSEGVMASLLHEDPRFYQLGSKQNFFKRVVYAGTRPLIGRTDSGRTTPNFAALSGYLGAAALAQVYYPPPNQGVTQVMQTWGTGIGGAALGDEVTEFLPDVLQFLHLKRVTHP